MSGQHRQTSRLANGAVAKEEIIIKEIMLSRGYCAIVDDEDYETLSQWKWHYSGGYAVRNERMGDGKRRSVRMHRVIAGIDCVSYKEKIVDHVNGEGLDNRKSNLRVCSHADNVKNIRKDDLKGVMRSRSTKNTWIARIRKDKELFNIGSFSNEIAAANAYNYFAKKYHGDFCNLNAVPFMEKEQWMKFKSTSGTGVKGVRTTNSGKFTAYIREAGKQKNLGTYVTLEEAVSIRESYLNNEGSRLNETTKNHGRKCTE